MNGMKTVKKDGKELFIRFRKYSEGEEETLIACIRDEYEDTYFKKNLYQPEWIKEEADNGHITFLVVWAEGSDAERTPSGEVVGMLILKEFYPKESMCEIASQIFRKKYRGYGLAQPFFEYAMEILKSRHYSAAYCLPVLFHDTTQRLLYRLGLRATGFVLNVFYMDRITHSYKRDRNRKHSQGIQIMAMEKKDAGVLYLPEEHAAICRKIYEELGVAYRVEKPCGKRKKEGVPLQSDWEWKQNEEQCSLEVCIDCVGADLTEVVERLQSRFLSTEMQTINVFLNINDKNAVWAYEKLREAGFFFTGLKPLCSDREYMVLHHAGSVKIVWEDYVLTEEFRELAEYVKTHRNRV